EIAQAHGRVGPAVEAQRGRAGQGGLQQRLVGGHVVGAGGDRVGQQPHARGVHRRIGSLAARTSSGRLMRSVCGALCRKSGSSARMRSRVSAKASSVSLLSVSVGSIISASGTTSGKYTVGAW